MKIHNRNRTSNSVDIGQFHYTKLRNIQQMYISKDRFEKYKNCFQNLRIMKQNGSYKVSYVTVVLS